MLKFISFLLFIVVSISAYALHPVAHVEPHNLHDKELIMERYEILDIFKMDTLSWTDGSSIVILLLPWSDPAHEEFISNYLGLNLNRYRRDIEGKINSGDSVGFIRVESLDDMLYKLHDIHGSVGYTEDSLLMEVRGAIIPIIAY